MLTRRTFTLKTVVGVIWDPLSPLSLEPVLICNCSRVEHFPPARPVWDPQRLLPPPAFARESHLYPCAFAGNAYISGVTGSKRRRTIGTAKRLGT